MEKQKITVTVAGKNYTLVSGDAPEFVKRVASFELYAGIRRRAGVCEAGGIFRGPEAERNGSGNQPAFRAGGCADLF